MMIYDDICWQMIVSNVAEFMCFSDHKIAMYHDSNLVITFEFLLKYDGPEHSDWKFLNINMLFFSYKKAVKKEYLKQNSEHLME